MHGHPWKRCLLEGSILCSKISMYFSALMVPSQKCKLPLPRALTQPHTMTDPGFRFRRCCVQSTLKDGSAQFVLLYTLYVFLLSLFTRLTSALFIYDKRTLLDIGHRCTNLLQDTLSTDPAWPLEILRNAEVNKGHPNNPRR